MDTRNFQIVEGAQNDIFPVYQVPKDLFDLMFPNEMDVAFLDEVDERLRNAADLHHLTEVEIWARVYASLQDKKAIQGIHGTLHSTGSPCRKEFFPARREAMVIHGGTKKQGMG